MKTVTLKVNGMTCHGCARGVTRALQRVPGVVSAQVSLDNAQATVAFDPAQVTPAQLKAAVDEAGYTAILPAAPVEST
ncbi:MAG TPA: heavy-metal-associated domain-containing protein [Burkholderiales bacterium]|nr:heavy-metal-associated domain-containing protein [Burkholderiales bacterium]